MVWNPNFSLEDIPPALTGPPLTGEEAEAARHLSLLLAGLFGYVSYFESALTLFRFAQSQFKQGNFTGARWPLIAARDAALTRYHFTVAMNAINGRIGYCPTLLPHLDKRVMKKAMGLLGSDMGTTERVRHAVAHSADPLKHPGNLAKNRGPEGSYETPNLELPNLANVYLGGELNGDRFVATRIHNGKPELLSFQMNEGELDRLRGLQRMVYAAYRPIETEVFGRPPLGQI